MYPMLLNPEFKSDIWGGTALIDEFGFNSDLSTVSSALLLSGKEKNGITIKSGKLADTPLNEALSDFRKIPVDIKLIHTLDRTSIKVSLCKDGPPFNSGTILYIVDCEKDAEIIYGLYRDASVSEFERASSQNQIPKLCNYVKVRAGDVFIIPSGTIYAIGKGITALQINSSDARDYRIYDYGRTHPDNKPRALHTKAIINHILTEKSSLPNGKAGEMTLYPFGIVKEIFSCENFSCQTLNIDGTFGAYEKSSMISIITIDGSATISYPSGNIHINKGDSVLIPRDTKIKITGKAQLLYTTF